MAIYLTSDFHFNHNKPFIFLERGFQSVDEMNKTLIENFNSIVKPNDDVYILGDCMLGGADSLEKGLGLMSWLKGKLHLIRGNHDSEYRWNAYSSLHNVIEKETSIFLKYELSNSFLKSLAFIADNSLSKLFLTLAISIFALYIKNY